MKKRPLVTALAFAALLSPTLPVLAAESSQDSVTAPQTHNRELTVGDKAPDQYKREDAAVKDWKARGLPAPEKESHWVRMGDHYVMVQITNGVVVAIHPAS